jgi:hypothetical protein
MHLEVGVQSMKAGKEGMPLSVISLPDVRQQDTSEIQSSLIEFLLRK